LSLQLEARGRFAGRIGEPPAMMEFNEKECLRGMPAKTILAGVLR
jgi:hypothetical protein